MILTVSRTHLNQLLTERPAALTRSGSVQIGHGVRHEQTTGYDGQS